MAHQPMNEATPGEKDGVPWFDTRIGIKKYVTSGAHIYNRNVVGVEAYTFIHWERYRTTLEELKIASDGFLRTGANKFYNHGYSYSPERSPAPSRTVPFAARISHPNVWWKYYRLLADYIGRSSYLLQQGTFAPDIAIYSPLANQWTLNVLNARKWTREFYWGDLGKLLIANGYDFDLLNDEALQKIAVIENGKIKIHDLEYKILIIPNIKSLPLESLKFIQKYIKKGGVVITLESLPENSVGFEDYISQDELVKSISKEIFPERSGITSKKYGEGTSYFMKLVINRQDVLDWQSSALDPFVNTLRKHCLPDFSIDFVKEGLRENNGLTFLHRKSDELDIYFVTNIQDRAINIPVTFRVQNKTPWEWNPYNGEILPVLSYEKTDKGTKVPLILSSYESTFIIFKDEVSKSHVKYTDLYKITNIKEDKIEVLANKNGIFHLVLNQDKSDISRSVNVKNIPAPFIISGDWKSTFVENDITVLDTSFSRLTSWTENDKTRHFSGTATYNINFDLHEEYISDDHVLLLDPGKVGNIAEVELNGVKVGTTWMREQTLDISDVLISGTNHLKIFITNTLINRISAMKTAPPVPEHLVSKFGSGITTYSAGMQKTIEMGFKPLPQSGLMGPVTIKVLKKVNVKIN